MIIIYRFYEDYQITGSPSFPSPFSGFYAYQTESSNWTSSIGLTYFDVSAQIELTSTSGTSFDIASIDISRGDGNTGLIPVGFTGNKSDGSQVFQTYWFTDSILGKTEQFNFGSQFTDLTSLVWEQGAEWHQFDNIKVSAVPVPSTIFLFSSSLLLLLLTRQYVASNN